MTDRLTTYQIKVKFMDSLKYGQFVTAPSEEEAIKLFVEEYLYIASKRCDD
jgi:hypothetical protein